MGSARPIPITGVSNRRIPDAITTNVMSGRVWLTLRRLFEHEHAIDHLSGEPEIVCRVAPILGRCHAVDAKTRSCARWRPRCGPRPIITASETIVPLVIGAH